ncbi:hypothetical protein [Micromonospora sp. NPDC048063]|uniref:hypothetical protein n=1 Tax=Micromonospora sp. NPDC048063 TaxID=3364256 RepID=UPI00371835FA
MWDLWNQLVRLWDWLLRSNPDAWAAVAGWTTAGIATVAGFIAYHQVKEAKRLRQEQAQPYVVAYMEPSQADQQIIDLVVKNFGTTAATDVRIQASPGLMRSGGSSGEVENVKLFDCLPVLVPQQEWRIFWDSGLSRKDTHLPDEYEVTVSYKDSRGNKLDDTKAVLDWGVYKSRLWVQVYGAHDTAKALRDMRDVFKSWAEGRSGGLSVFVRSGHEKDRRTKRTRQEQKSRLVAMRSRLSPAQSGGTDDRQLPAPSAASSGVVPEGPYDGGTQAASPNAGPAIGS